MLFLQQGLELRQRLEGGALGRLAPTRTTAAAAHAAAAHAAGTQLVVPILTVADVEAFAVDDLARVRGEVAVLGAVQLER